MELIIHAEALNKLFKLDPSHGELPQKGYVREYELFLNRNYQRVKKKNRNVAVKGPAIKSRCLATMLTIGDLN